MSVHSELSNINMNEKLYIDSYFKFLHNKKNEPKLDENVDIIREFILLSNVHCQNMTELGERKFKTELYEEYCKLVDSKNDKDLLPLVSNDNKTTCSQIQLQGKQNLMTNLCKKFKNFLHRLTNKVPTESNPLTFNPIKPVNDQRNASSSNSITNQFRKESRNKVDIPMKRPVIKNKLESFSENKAYGNKKVCLQPSVQPKKPPVAAEVGFVSASSMYRNPLKKQESSSTVSTNSDEACTSSVNEEHSELSNHETLKHFDKKIVDIVLNEIMDFSPNIKWSDIAGLDFVKTTVQEIVIWPLLRPDIFTGLRAPPRGILLFGPPGTGKTLIGKCIATESNSTFFCISASSLASKWVGESEQMVRALFAAARLNQPAVIFIDEIDSLLSQRSDKDQDFTRKLKTEFLVQFDGAKTNTEERVLVVGATNRPHELDEAARRRFVKRLYVPLPDESARCQIIKKLIGAHQQNLSEEDLKKICNDTDGYSGSDVAHLCKEAAMGPIRCIGPENIKTVSLDQVRPISLCDFTDALRQVRASVVADDLNYYMEWNKKFGSFGIQL